MADRLCKGEDKMILDIKTGELTRGSYFKKTYWLTPTQTYLLSYLVDNELHTYEELTKKTKMSDTYIRVTIARIKQRVKDIDITSLKRFGIRLEDRIKLIS